MTPDALVTLRAAVETLRSEREELRRLLHLAEIRIEDLEATLTASHHVDRECRAGRDPRMVYTSI